jgi:hypothetical protein
MPKLDASALLAALGDRGSPRRHRATLVLGGLEPDADIDVAELIKGLDSPDDDVVFWAEIGLSRLRERSAAAIPRLITLVQREPLFIRQTAVDALARVGPRDPAARAAFFAVLRHPDPDMRRDALRRSVDLPDHTAEELQAIASLENDPVPGVASSSKAALRNIELRRNPPPPAPAPETNEKKGHGIDVDEFFAQLKRTVRRKPTFRSGMAAMLKWCAQRQPHPDWAKLARLPFAADAAAARTWLNGVIAKEPASFPIRGIYFPVVELVDARDNDLTAVTVAFTGQYEPEDEKRLWAIGDLRHDPKRGLFKARTLQKAAERFHREDGIGSEAVYHFGLTYAALLAQSLLTPALHKSLGSPREPIGILTGWNDGDTLLLGELKRTGLMPAKPPAQF